jgi:homoserine O-succinyltransferase
MPIKIPGDLPARHALESENIFVMTEERAVTQDIRPLEIAIVNLMPTKIATETQLLRVLGNSPLQVNITLVRMSGRESKNTPPEHLERFYQTFDQIRHRAFDGMIITGAPVEHLDFHEVDYWDEIVAIMDYTSINSFSTLYICWAAQAALRHYYNVPKHALPKKLSGVFAHQVMVKNCRLFRGFDEEFFIPHSRYTELRRADLEKINSLHILAQSPQAGFAIMQAGNGSRIFITGHLEYDANTLDLEYHRDMDKGLNPDIPVNYYKSDNPALPPQMAWRAHAHLFFSNWLNYYVYQDTPYDLNAISGAAYAQRTF